MLVQAKFQFNEIAKLIGLFSCNNNLHLNENNKKRKAYGKLLSHENNPINFAISLNRKTKIFLVTVKIPLIF